MTDYYVRMFCNSDFMSCEDFWAVESNVAHRNILPSDMGTLHSHPGKDILTTLQDCYIGSVFHKLELGPGEYYPRMARPDSTLPDSSPGSNPDKSPAAQYARTTSTGQLHALIQELQKICRVVHPDGRNLNAYGHEIRNIIIIACTEVEAQWKNILKANGKVAQSRSQYALLSPAMKLAEYKVVLPWYPWLAPIEPFKNWVPVPKGKKQVLPWYDAYNEIKHDRERNFSQAKLIHALHALAGCFVILCAQYGWDFARRGEAAQDVFFQLIGKPTWHPSEIYVPTGGSNTARFYQFK